MLEPILASVRARLGGVIEAGADWRAAADDAPAVRDFGAALVAPGLGVIAEVKRRSPSAGVLAADLDAGRQAGRYETGGAAAISVLTEPDHFAGSTVDLTAVRLAVDLPVLRKDFLLHPAQVWQSRALGADAVLLIVAILDDATLAALLGTAHDAGLAALVEVHTEAEAERAVAAGAPIVGVNNRDLATFRVDLAIAETVRASLPAGTITVAESGVSGPEGAARMAAAGFDAILVGEALVRAPDPGALIGRLAGASR
jgi:indole-3-glycerol phosphate synthase